MGELKANLPGAHRYILPTMAAGYAYIASQKLLRSSSAKGAIAAHYAKLVRGARPYAGKKVHWRFKKKPEVNKSSFFKKLAMAPRTRKRSYSKGKQKMVTLQMPPTPARNSGGQGRSSDAAPVADNAMDIDQQSSTVYSVRRRRGGGRYIAPSRAQKRRRLRRRYKKKKGMKGFNPSKHGASLIVERSGIVQATTNHAVYVGHGASTEQFWVNVCRAVIRKLFRMAGEEITDWNHNLNGTSVNQNPYILRTWYSTSSTPNVMAQDSQPLVVPNTPQRYTYSDVAATWFTRLNAIFAETDVNIVLYKLELLQPEIPNQVMARLDLSKMVIMYKITSKLKMQNASIAGSGTADAEDEDSGNVTHNPLVGKFYRSKYRANGFKFSTIPEDGVGPWVGAPIQQVADRVTGFTSFVTSDPNGPDFLLKFKKPPHGGMFGLKSKPYGMSAGQMKQIVWIDTRSITFNRLIELVKTTFTQNTLTQYCNLGRFQMVGLEKKMSCISTEFNVVLHWVLEQTYSCVVKNKLGKVPRIQQIVDPA